LALIQANESFKNRQSLSVGGQKDYWQSRRNQLLKCRTKPL